MRDWRPQFLHNLEMRGRERRRVFRIAFPIAYVIFVPGLQIVATVFGAGHGHSDLAIRPYYILGWPWAQIGGEGGVFLMSVLQMFLLGYALDYLVSLIPSSRPSRPPSPPRQE